LEAVIGAIYLDGSFAACEPCILQWYENRLCQATAFSVHQKDPKTCLQEYLQAQKRPLPQYILTAQTGAPHEPVFHIACHLPDLPLSDPLNQIVGTGTSRRRAEQQAAQALLVLLLGPYS